MTFPITGIELKHEQDIVVARQLARTIAGVLGFGTQDQTRIATAVSEVARNAFTRTGAGKIEFLISDDSSTLLARATDRGSTAPELTQVGRMMDVFSVDSRSGGTAVLLGRKLPRRPLQTGSALVAMVSGEVAKLRPASPLEELETQNTELLVTLVELRQQKERLVEVNRELADTNRGVVALLAELDERAHHLKRVNDVKTSFLSNMTHEFRTPLNSIISLAGILTDRFDGPLTPEQDKQVAFIRQAAEGLSGLVNDLLDLAKAEAGRVVVRPAELRVSAVFSALRGMLRPLVAHNTSVTLVIEEPAEDITLHTDEAKVSQILRNLIANAIKFTERGEVRVKAHRGEDNMIVFEVSDTGIGIDEKDHDRIFEEFSQMQTQMHGRIHSTGLGLPLSRRLLGLLGGTIRVSSALGVGSTFFASIPAQFVGAREGSIIATPEKLTDGSQAPVLVIEDNPEALFLYERLLRGTGYRILPAHTIQQGRERLESVRPAAIILDARAGEESSWLFMEQIKTNADTKEIPLIVSASIDNEARARRLGADAFCVKPNRNWLIERLRELTARKRKLFALVIDDDEISRYLLSGMLTELGLVVSETAGGAEGLQHVSEVRPDVIFLDLRMPEMDGFKVLEHLKGSSETTEIPVVIYTSSVLTDAERQLLSQASSIVPKVSGSRQAAVANIRDCLRVAGVGGPKNEHP